MWSMDNDKIKEIKKEIAEQEWIFAKTYAKTAPHEYIVRKSNPKFFDKMKKLINKEGYGAPWRDGTIYKYLKIGKYKYWCIEDILNRDKI